MSLVGGSKSCVDCGTPLSRPDATRCRGCSIRARPKVRDAYVDEVEHLLRFAYSAEDICEELNVSAEALHRSLYRADRPDLAQVFSPMIAKARKVPCPDCQTPISRNAKFCRSCSNRRRTRGAQREV